MKPTLNLDPMSVKISSDNFWKKGAAICVFYGTLTFL